MPEEEKPKYDPVLDKDKPKIVVNGETINEDLTGCDSMRILLQLLDKIEKNTRK